MQKIYICGVEFSHVLNGLLGAIGPIVAVHVDKVILCEIGYAKMEWQVKIALVSRSRATSALSR